MFEGFPGGATLPYRTLFALNFTLTSLVVALFAVALLLVEAARLARGGAARPKQRRRGGGASAVVGPEGEELADIEMDERAGLAAGEHGTSDSPKESPFSPRASGASDDEFAAEAEDGADGAGGGGGSGGDGAPKPPAPRDYAIVLLVWVVTFAVWLTMALETMGRMDYKPLLICLLALWLPLAWVLAHGRSEGSCGDGVQQLLLAWAPRYVCAQLSFSLLQLSIMSFVGWPLGGLLASLPLSARHMLESGARFHRGVGGLRASRPALRIVGGWALACLLLAYVTTGFCITFFNQDVPAQLQLWPRSIGGSVTMSTRFSRSFLPPACGGLAPCHVYLTLSEDASRSVFVNVHMPLRSKAVTVQYVMLSAAGGRLHDHAKIQEGGWAAGGAERASAWDQEQSLEERGRRSLQTALLRDLEPGAVYAFRLLYGDGAPAGAKGGGKRGDATTRQRSKVRRFRTAGAGFSALTFVVGGDAGMNARSQGVAAVAAEQEPLFAAVGGDIAYSNGMASCYR